ncbi:MAG: hypothetical protein M0Z95_17795 [Actinomycetota bacterium]|jgi:hypothetical protein|nr:hypothetical protein [Actinomycetota bacterium]
MSRRPRDQAAERAAITAAADRLLGGAPLHSATGKLTQTELIHESQLRRDVVYEHHDLIDAFKAQVRAQHNVPTAMQAVVDQRDRLTAQIADIRAELHHERDVSTTLRRLAAELSLELAQAREAPTATVTRLPAHPRRTRPRD